MCCLWEEKGEYPSFTKAIDRIVELPNLNEVHLRFSEVCRGVRDDGLSRSFWRYGVEPAPTRLSMLSACFKAMAARAKNDDASSFPIPPWPNVFH